MTTIVNVGEAKTHLSKWLEMALNGADIVIARNGKPLVHLTPLVPPSPKFGVGRERLGDDRTYEVLAPTNGTDLADWEGAYAPAEIGW